MADKIDWEKGVITPPAGSSNQPDWESGTITPPPKATGVFRKAGDVGLSIAKGIIGVPETAVGLADLVSGGAAGKAVEGLGVRFKDAKQVLTDLQSDDLKGKQQQFQQADGVVDKLGVALSNPSLIANTVAESLPVMGAGGVVARGALGIGARGVSSAAGGVGPAVPGLLARTVGAEAAPVVAGAIGEGVAGAGSAAEQIRQETPTGYMTGTQSALAAGSGAATALLAVGGGALSRRFGWADPDAMIAAGTRNVVAPATARGAIRRTAEGAVAESLFEEVPQSLSEQAFQNAALGRPLTEGMADAGVMGGLAGAAMGGVAGAMARPAVAPAPTAPPAGPLTRAAMLALPAPVVHVDGAGRAKMDGVPSGGFDTGQQEGTVGRTNTPLTSTARDLVPSNTINVDGQGNASPPPQPPAGSPPRQPGEPGPRETGAMGQGRGSEGADFPVQGEIPPIRARGPLATSAGMAPQQPAIEGPRALAGPDTITDNGQPFRSGVLAQRAARQAGLGFRPVAVEGGWVVRRDNSQAEDAQIKEPTNAAQPRPEAPAATAAAPDAQPAGDRPGLGPVPEVRSPAGGAPQVVPEAEAVHQAATSPLNDLPEPSDAQKAAGNYKLGRMRIAGLNISVENPQGSTRRGTDEDGRAWETPMAQAHYGYVRGTTAADGDKLDVFVKPGTAEDYAGPVFVIDQVNPKTGKFDEHKVVMGAADQAEAEAIYRSSYEPDWTGMAAITALPMEQFQAWAKSDRTKKPLGNIKRPAATAPAAADSSPAPASQALPDAPGGVRPGRADAVQPSAAPAAAVAPAPSAAPAPATKGLRIGITPNDAEPVTVRGNVVYLGQYPLQNFDTGEDVTVPEGANELQIRKAIADSGALTKKQKFFGAAVAREPAPEQNPTAPNTPQQAPSEQSPSASTMEGKADTPGRQGKPAETAPNTAPAPKEAEQTGYSLPDDVGKDWTKYKSATFTPTPRQQIIMDAVQRALDAGAFYSDDILQRVARDLKVSAEVRASNRSAVQGGDLGYDAYYARGALDARKEHAAEAKAREEMALKAGDELGTLVFNDGKVTTSVTVTGTDDAGRYELTGKRGPATVKVQAPAISIKFAIERAHERGKRKTSYAEFLSERTTAPTAGAAPAPAATAAPATHQDPGQAPEPATPAVIAESLKTAAREEDRKPSAMKAELLARIDEAITEAPDYTEYQGIVKSMGLKDANAMYTRDGSSFGEKFAPKGYSRPTRTFDVEGDGKFTVNNTVRQLLTFREKVDRSPGFRDAKTPPPATPRATDTLDRRGTDAAIANMIDERDFEAAKDFAAYKGVDVDEVKLTKVLRDRWDKWKKTGESAAKIAAWEAEQAAKKEAAPDALPTFKTAKLLDAWLAKNVDDPYQLAREDRTGKLKDEGVMAIVLSPGSKSNNMRGMPSVVPADVRLVYRLKDGRLVWWDEPTGVLSEVDPDDKRLIPNPDYSGAEAAQEAAVQPEKAIAGQTFDDWVQAEYEGNEYREKYLEAFAGDEKRAMLGAVLGIIDNDRKSSELLRDARSKYLGTLLGLPREASIDLKVWDALDNMGKVEAQRHFYDLDGRISKRTQEETRARVQAEKEKKAPYEAAFAEVDAEIRRLDKLPGPETQKQKELSARRDRLREALFQIGQGKEPDGRLLRAAPSPVAESQAPAIPPVSSREGQMRLANRGSRIAALKLMNEQLRKIAPAEAWADSNIEDATDLDALQDQISGALVAAQRGPAAVNPLRAELEAMSGAELRGIMERLNLAGTRMTQDERVEALLAEDETEVRAAMQAPAPAAKAAAAAPAPAEKPASKIEDFGQKLEGARKDYAATLKDAEAVDIAAEPLSKSWPEPDYDKLLAGGADPYVVAFVHAARDEVPTKPQKGWKLKGWVQSVETLRGASKKLLAGEISKDRVQTLLNDDAFGAVRRAVGSRAELYELVGHAKSLKGVTFAENHYTLYKGQNNVRKWVVEQKVKSTAFSNWPRELAVADTKAEMLEQFKAKFSAESLDGDKAKAATKGQFIIYRKRNQEGAFIGKKIGREYIDLKKLPDVAAARAYLESNTADLSAALERYKDTPFERNPENRPRVGDDHRNGAAVTPEVFADTFGFRGVQFGNYVEQDRRQSDLNQTFDALMDMAAVLGVPPRALSLNGRLGLAFGARGKGGKNAPAAHYEPDTVVINLTKGNGPGSLGHEWWHAVDNYFGKGFGEGGFATDGARVDRLRAEMQAAFKVVRNATQVPTLRKRAAELDKRRTKPYWNTPLELSARAFESYLIAKLNDQGAANDYLANVVDEKVWNLSEEARATFFGGEAVETYPYPGQAELPAVRAAFDEFFKVVETREDDAGNVAMFSRAQFRRGDTTGHELRVTEIQKAVSRLSADWLRRPDIYVIDSMDDAPGPIREEWLQQNSQGAAGSIEGFHYRGQVYLVADALVDEADVRRVLFHEALGHWGLRNVFGAQLNPILDQIATMRQALGKAKATQYGLAWTIEQARDMIRRERIAAMDAPDSPRLDLTGAEFEKAAQARLQMDRRDAAEEVLAEMAQTRPELGWVQRAIAAIRRFLRAHGVSLGLSDNDIIANYILPARGWVERGRQSGPSSVTNAAQFARDTTSPVATETEAFKRWFAGSKVVDTEGNPLVVYHGTRSDVAAFADDKVKGRFPNSEGFYFTSRPQHASVYADSIQNASEDFNPASRFAIPVAEGANVMPAYVSLQNPKVLTVSAWGTLESRVDGDGGAQVRAAREAGHDGVIVKREAGDEWDGMLVIAFRPEQIKSAIGNRGTFDPGNPDIRFSRSTIAGATTRQYSPEQQRAMRNVGFEVDQPTYMERAQALWKDAGKKLAQGIADQFAPIKDLDAKAYSLLRLSKGASGAFETFLHGGKLKLSDGVYDFDEAARGGVLDSLLIPLQGEHHDFFRWVAANRAERLAREGRENLFTPQDIADLKTLADGQLAFDFTLTNGMRAGQTTRSRAEAYRDSLATFNAFNKNVLDLAEQSGLIDGESRHLWEHEFYVPFYRVAEDADGGIRGANIKTGVIRQEAFKKLKGGGQALNMDLLDNTLLNWAHLLDAAAKNRGAKATLEAAQRMGVAVEAPERVAREIGNATGNKQGVVWFMDEGLKRYFVVDDRYILEALTSLEYAGMRNPVMDAMGAFKHALTVGVTASPFFKVRNLIRDSVQVIGTSGIGVNPAANVAQGWKLTDPKSDAYFRLLAGGGTIHFGTMMEGNEAKRVQALVESGVDSATILNSQNKVKAFYRKYIEPGITAYNELGNRGEAVNRAALYQQLRAQGKDHAEASLQARDLMDFSMQGTFTTIRFLTQVVPFFNARIQGMYKLGRAAKEDPARFSAVLGATALFSIALLAAYGDDDDWKKREEWDRNNYWWFKFGGTAFRIPKPFEIGAVATLAERSWELAFDEEMTGTRFRKQVQTLLADNLSMNPIPQLIKPVVDVYANKDSFTGRPIETMDMERLRADYRFTDRTSMFARGVSTTMNAATGLLGAEALSPVQVDHMLRGYFGWLGAFIVGAGDTIARPATDQPSHPTPDYWKTVTGGMASDLRDAPSRYVSQMYEQAKEIEKAYGTWKMLLREGKIDEAREFREDNAELLNQHKQVERVKKAESALNQRARMIERSNMDPDRKRELLRQINEQKDRTARLAS